MFCRVLLLVVLGLTMCMVSEPNYAASDSYCFDAWACVEKIEENQGVSYWLVNQKPYVITTTLEVNTRNLRRAGSQQKKHSINQVLEGYQRTKVLALFKINKAKTIWYDESFYWAPGSMFATHQKNITYHYPYATDKYYPIVQGFGGGYSHSGASQYAVDFAMPVGTPIHAARGGVVIDLVENNELGGASRRYAKYANYVIVLHDDQTTGEYYHLVKNGVVVDVDDKVKVGQKLGYSGNTGFSSLPHLHFAVYQAKTHGGYQSLPFSFIGQ